MTNNPRLTRDALWTLPRVSKKPPIPRCNECPVVLFCAMRNASQQKAPPSYCSHCPYAPGFNDLQPVWHQKFQHSVQDAQSRAQQALTRVKKMILDFDHWLFTVYKKALLKNK